MTQFSTAPSTRRLVTNVAPSLIAATPNARYIAAHLTPAAFSNISHPADVVRRNLTAVRHRSLEEKLFDARATCKITTRQFAMLFDPDWQARFFRQLDLLMDADEWAADDEPVTKDSFITLIRLLIVLRDKRRPSLGIANRGNIVATWFTKGIDRVTIECLPNDRVRWIVTIPLYEEKESAAGETTLDRLLNNLQPYNPQHWFDSEGSKSS